MGKYDELSYSDLLIKVNELSDENEKLKQQVDHWKEKTYEYADYAELSVGEDGELIY